MFCHSGQIIIVFLFYLSKLLRLVPRHRSQVPDMKTAKGLTDIDGVHMADICPPMSMSAKESSIVSGTWCLLYLQIQCPSYVSISVCFRCILTLLSVPNISFLEKNHFFFGCRHHRISVQLWCTNTYIMYICIHMKEYASDQSRIFDSHCTRPLALTGNWRILYVYYNLCIYL